MTKKYVRGAILGAFAVLAGFGPTRADEPFRTIFYNSVEPTLISGFDASQRTIKEPGNGAILSGLELDEVGDNPCFIRAHWWRFSGEDVPQELTTDFNICSKPVDGDESTLFPNARETKTGVRAIQVCNNGQNNHRLKGVKIFGAVVDQNDSGKVVADRHDACSPSSAPTASSRGRRSANAARARSPSA